MFLSGAQSPTMKCNPGAPRYQSPGFPRGGKGDIHVLVFSFICIHACTSKGLSIFKACIKSKKDRVAYSCLIPLTCCGLKSSELSLLSDDGAGKGTTLSLS